MKGKLLIVVFALLLAGGCRNDAQKAMKEKRQQEMQTKENRVSPPMIEKGVIAGNEVTIQYGSPRVTGPDGNNRDGKIWGELVPYDAVWRTGANEATTITFSKDVLIEGQLLEKDTYSIFTIPNPDEWTWIFNLNETQWGAFKYNPSDDALRITASPQPLETLQEEMKFEILSDSIPGSGIVRLSWERLQVAFRFENAPEK